MRLPTHLVEKAVRLLRRPREAHELAELLFPERDYPDLVSKRRAGHASGRDLIDRGVAVKNADGTYGLSPQVDPNGPQMEETPEELAWEDGQVVRVRREVIGELPLPEPAQAPQPMPRHVPQAPQQAPLSREAQEQIAAQFCEWLPSKKPDIQAITNLCLEALNGRAQDGHPLDERGREQRYDEASARARALMTDVYWWYKRAQCGPPIPWFEERSASRALYGR